MTRDTMTQRHQKFYELIGPNGNVWRQTTSRTIAARWQARCLRPDPPRDPDNPGPRVQTSMDVWFSSANADAAALAQWESDMDRRYGL